MNNTLSSHCAALEAEFSTKQILDFLCDGEALGCMGFYDEDEVEEVYNYYNAK